MSRSAPLLSSPPTRHWLAGLCLAVALACSGCSNYDFSQARTANGGYDIQKLMTDLKESGEEQLVDFMWVPFIYFGLTAFTPSNKDFPEGYSLISATGVGPLFMVNNVESTAVDPEGLPVESSEQRSWIWSLGRLLDERVETKSGTRIVDSSRWLFGLFGRRSVRYVK